MKVIDLLNKIANDEIKQGTKFRINGIEYIYNNGYIAKNDKNKTMENFYISQRLLNDNVEIIEEDEFIDIEEITLNGEKMGYGVLSEWLDFSSNNNEQKICSSIECLGVTLNDLIKNQKLIINKLKEEGK